MARTVSIGNQDFGKMIEEDYFYVDKTDFIKEWWESGDVVTLITRPRRFGKTLIMSMLEHFFSIKHSGRSDLFENLNIWKEEAYRQLQGTYPLIFLSFASVKAPDYQNAYADIRNLVAREYCRHSYLLEDDDFQPAVRGRFERMMSGKADFSELASSINQLSECMYNYYGKKVIILLDEYDTPMQEAYVSGYWDALTGFIRELFHSTLKTNPYLERAVLTGITRISRESVFSDLNHLEVVTTTSVKYETSFGFTENEVCQALEEFGLQKDQDEVKRWYDGFRFGNCESMYNPWSITQFLDKGEFADYWANTSSNKLLKDLIQKGSPEVKMVVEDLLHGKSFRTSMDEQIVFDELDQDDEAVWSFLVAGGYLKVVDCRSENGEFGPAGRQYELMVTNMETSSVFRRMVHSWFSNKRYGYHKFITALLDNDLDNMNTYMNEVALYTFSSFDSGNHPSEKTEPERFYHGFVLGLMVDIAGRYKVSSNRESGLGRYDVLLEPRSCADDGIIFEFKVFDPKKDADLSGTAQNALRQIIDKKYAAELEAKGTDQNRIRIYGFAFEGKRVLIKGGYIRDYENG